MGKIKFDRSPIKDEDALAAADEAVERTDLNITGDLDDGLPSVADDDLELIPDEDEATIETITEIDKQAIRDTVARFISDPNMQTEHLIPILVEIGVDKINVIKLDDEFLDSIITDFIKSYYNSDDAAKRIVNKKFDSLSKTGDIGELMDKIFQKLNE